MRIADFKVRTRLMVGFGLLLITTAFLGGIGLMKLNTLHATVNELVTDDWQTAKNSIGLRSNIRSLAARTMEFLLADDASKPAIREKLDEHRVVVGFDVALEAVPALEREHRLALCHPEVEPLRDPLRCDLDAGPRDGQCQGLVARSFPQHPPEDEVEEGVLAIDVVVKVAWRNPHLTGHVGHLRTAVAPTGEDSRPGPDQILQPILPIGSPRLRSSPRIHRSSVN